MWQFVAKSKTTLVFWLSKLNKTLSQIWCLCLSRLKLLKTHHCVLVRNRCDGYILQVWTLVSNIFVSLQRRLNQSFTNAKNHKNCSSQLEFKVQNVITVALYTLKLWFLQKYVTVWNFEPDCNVLPIFTKP